MSLYTGVRRAVLWIGGLFYREDRDHVVAAAREKRELARQIATGNPFEDGLSGRLRDRRDRA